MHGLPIGTQLSTPVRLALNEFKDYVDLDKLFPSRSTFYVDSLEFLQTFRDWGDEVDEILRDENKRRSYWDVNYLHPTKSYECLADDPLNYDELPMPDDINLAVYKYFILKHGLGDDVLDEVLPRKGIDCAQVEAAYRKVSKFHEERAHQLYEPLLPQLRSLTMRCLAPEPCQEYLLWFAASRWWSWDREVVPGSNPPRYSWRTEQVARLRYIRCNPLHGDGWDDNRDIVKEFYRIINEGLGIYGRPLGEHCHTCAISQLGPPDKDESEDEGESFYAAITLPASSPDLSPEELARQRCTCGYFELETEKSNFGFAW
ncbi:hypothetical protein AX16_006285 [Volvariella volvacea WC 439]|nr:hypothetical protein AX16_006285 [Volvariella volvacea WC 439]